MKIDRNNLTYDNWTRCCRQALENSKSPHGRAYAKAGLTLHEIYPNDLSEAVKVQAMYMQGGFGDWKGEAARECKAWIDAFCKYGLDKKGPTRRTRRSK